MKDIEKIKSEDLAAQVQDANPGNFAIEQEVAQLVGATVPAPTEPSADDARELGAQLLVFLRRALLPIRSALRTDLADIYAHLDSRCTDYTPAAYAPYQPLPSYDPMGTPPTPRTVANLLTALTAFAPRKISNGSATADGIPDGTSLAHILLSTASSEVTALIDDNTDGWALTKDPLTIFPNATTLSLNCTSTTLLKIGNSSTEDLQLPYIESLQVRDTYGTASRRALLVFKNEVMRLPRLKSLLGTTAWSGAGFIQDNDYVRVIEMKALTEFMHGRLTGMISYCANLEEVWMSSLPSIRNNGAYGEHPELFKECPKLKLIEIGQGFRGDLYLADWNPTYSLENELTTFLQNFKEHIALRLTANGSGKTLTLSQAVRDAIHAAEATYGIEAIIVTQKGWTLSPAPTA